jgi:hypothetical protein
MATAKEPGTNGAELRHPGRLLASVEQAGPVDGVEERMRPNVVGAVPHAAEASGAVGHQQLPDEIAQSAIHFWRIVDLTFQNALVDAHLVFVVERRSPASQAVAATPRVSRLH